MIGRHQGVPILLAWGVVLVVLYFFASIPSRATNLLGHGRTLSMVSTGVLLLVLTMTVVGLVADVLKGQTGTRALALDCWTSRTGHCSILSVLSGVPPFFKLK